MICMTSDCIFCKIINQEIPSKTVYEDDRVYAFHDINPAAPTHILIIPKKHIDKLENSSSEDKMILGELMFRAKEIAKELGLKDGFRVVMNNGEGAGQTVFHIHLHLIAGRKLEWPPG